MRTPTDVIIRREWGKLVDAASGLGHTLTEPEQDTPASLVAECRQCWLPFAVDGQEKPYQFSAGLTTSCTTMS